MADHAHEDTGTIRDEQRDRLIRAIVSRTEVEGAPPSRRARRLTWILFAVALAAVGVAGGTLAYNIGGVGALVIIGVLFFIYAIIGGLPALGPSVGYGINEHEIAERVDRFLAEQDAPSARDQRTTGDD